MASTSGLLWLRHYCHKLSLVREVQVVEAEHLARPFDRFGDGHLAFLDLDADARTLSYLVERRGKTSPGGIAHGSHVRADVEHYC